MFVQINDIYSGLIFEYFKFKADSLIYSIRYSRKYQNTIFGQKLNKSEHNKFLKARKIDLRTTVYQAIETVFETVFALAPENNQLYNNIPYRILNSNQNTNFSRIKDIASSIDNLKFLDEKIIKVKNKKELISVGMSIFYFGIQLSHVNEKKYLNSLQAIKFALHLLAKEFQNRFEYNSYKHGLRVFEFQNKISLCNPDTREELISFDFSDSVTYYIKNKNEKIIETQTKVFDYRRDYAIINLCYNILYSITSNRDYTLNNKSYQDKSKLLYHCFFSEKKIKDCFNRNTKVGDLNTKETYE